MLQLDFSVFCLANILLRYSEILDYHNVDAQQEGMENVEGGS